MYIPPGPERLIRMVLAVAVVGGPLCFFVGGVLAPAVHNSGAATIAANAAVDPMRNALHLAAFLVASFLLPVGAVGMAALAYRVAPRLATAAGLLGVVGWLPFSGLTALDDLGREMARQPDSGAYATLLDAFTTSAVMTALLLIYIIGHLVAYVLFGIAMLRARVVPRWAGWSLIASSPVTVAAFVLPGEPGPVGVTIGAAGLALLFAGSVPVGWAMMASGRPAPGAGRPDAAAVG